MDIASAGGQIHSVKGDAPLFSTRTYGNLMKSAYILVCMYVCMYECMYVKGVTQLFCMCGTEVSQSV
jgi:hypothetical protein